MEATVKEVYSINPDNPVMRPTVEGKDAWYICDVYNGKMKELKRLSEIANICRTENTDPKLSSMLREIDSTLQELTQTNEE